MGHNYNSGLDFPVTKASSCPLKPTAGLNGPQLQRA
jgi:hypothetical protein